LDHPHSQPLCRSKINSARPPLEQHPLQDMETIPLPPHQSEDSSRTHPRWALEQTQVTCAAPQSLCFPLGRASSVSPPQHILSPQIKNLRLSENQPARRLSVGSRALSPLLGAGVGWGSSGSRKTLRVLCGLRPSQWLSTRG
jgi:hypothetical protein